jgi:hypothetical protein
MKLLIKLIIVAVIANATWRIGSVYARFYKFKDAVQDTTQFRGDKTDDQIHDRIFELAAQYDIPVTDDTLTITRQEAHTVVNASYTQPIEVVPGVKYPWPFSFHTDTFVYDAAKPSPR